MNNSHWQQTHSSSRSAGPSGHHTSTADFHDDDGSSGTQEVFQSVVRGRKSWKTARGGEVVWPPELESALLEGLEAYVPDDSRETRLLGRFPLRNRFISDYIMEKTGKRRTAKQVGSRLQQLRDTCGGKRLLSLLSPTVKPGAKPSNSVYRRNGGCSSNSDSSDSSSSTPTSPVTPMFGEASLALSALTSPSVICIDILPPNSTSEYSSSSYGSCSMSSDSTASSSPSDSTIRFASPPRPIQQIDPTITFSSRSKLDLATAESLFTVCIDGADQWRDTNCVEMHADSQSVYARDGLFLYSTVLVPSYWKTICQSSDPTKYTIKHQVVQKDHSGSRALYSALYKFCYPSSSSKLSSDAYARYTSPSIASSAPSSPRSANFPGMSSAGSSNYFAASPSPSRMDFGFDNVYYTSYSSSTHPLEQLDANHWDLTGFGGVGSGSGYSPGSEFSSNGTGEDYFGSASMVAGSASVHPGLFPPFVSGAGTEEYDFDGHSLSSGSRSNSLSPTSACFTFV